MNPESMGKLIRQLRKEKGMTQACLATMLHVSDKAVSKWERGAGCPDVALVPQLAQALGVSAESLLAGSLPSARKDVGSMKRIKVYQCPACGNLLTGTGSAEITCCGRPLEALKPQPADDMHRLTIQPMEDEWHVVFAHPMEKEHHLSFILEVGFDRICLVRLYPEGACEARLPRLPGGKFYCGCMKDGMFSAK